MAAVGSLSRGGRGGKGLGISGRRRRGGEALGSSGRKGRGDARGPERCRDEERGASGTKVAVSEWEAG
eukprot:scaffold65755_cov24-Tisochrysis_lutea.AAC.2